MMKNAKLATIGADTAESERMFAKNLPKRSGNYPTVPFLPPATRTTTTGRTPRSARIEISSMSASKSGARSSTCEVMWITSAENKELRRCTNLKYHRNIKYFRNINISDIFFHKYFDEI